MEDKIEQAVRVAIGRTRTDFRLWMHDEGLVETRRKDVDRRGFEQRLGERWKEPLEKLDLLYQISVALGGEVNVHFKDDSGALSRVRARLHAACCRIAAEAMSLLRAGHAGGAMARWRSLHEATVILYFISEAGEETAVRYFDYQGVQVWKSAKLFNDHHAKLNEEPFSEEEMAGFEAEYDDLQRRYGRSFVADYGWARAELDARGLKGKNGFAAIEASVGMEHNRPYYDYASNGIHMNVKATLAQLGLPDATNTVLGGASNYGLSVPGQSIATALTQATTAVLTSSRELHFAAYAEELTKGLLTEIRSSFKRVQAQIDVEERGKSEI